MNRFSLLVLGGTDAVRRQITDSLQRTSLPLTITALASLPDAPPPAADFVLLPWPQPTGPTLVARLRETYPHAPLLLLSASDTTPPPTGVDGVLPLDSLPQLADRLRPHLQAHLLEALHRQFAALATRETVADMLEALPRLAADLVAADGGIAMLRDPDDQTVLYPTGYNLPPDYTAERVQRPQGLVWRTLQQGETIHLDDYSAHPEALPKGKAAGFRSFLAVPLLAADQPIGALAVFRRRVQPFGPLDRRLLEILGILAGARLQETRLNATLLQQATELSLLHAMSTIAARADTVEELLQRTTGLLRRHFLPSNCGILLLDREQNALVPHASYHESGSMNLSPIPLGKGITGQVALSGQSRRLGNVHTDPDYLELDPAVQSELAVPIQVGGQVIGVINLESVHRDAFSSTDQSLLESVARQLASTLEKLRLLEEERRRRRLAEAMQAASTSLISTLDLDHVLNNILHLLQEVVPMDSGTVFLIEEGWLQAVATIGFEHPEKLLHERRPLENPLLLEVLQSRTPCILKDASRDARFTPWLEEHPIRGWMCAPLIARGEVIGFLTLDSRQENAFQARDSALVQTFANQAALAIHNARLFQQSRQRARELNLLYTSILDLSQALDEDDFFRRLNAQLSRHLQPDVGALITLTAEGQARIQMAALDGTPLEGWAGRTLTPDDFPPLRWLHQAPQPLLVQDVDRAPLLGLATHLDRRIQAWAALPLLSGTALRGLLLLEYAASDRLDVHNLEFLQAFAHQVSLMLENVRLHQKTLQAAERHAVLHWAGSAINQAGLDVEAVCAAAHQAARRLMPCDAFAITFYHAETQTAESLYLVDQGRRVPNTQSPAAHTLTGHVVSSGQGVRINDLTTYPHTVTRMRFGSPQPVRSIIAVPMRVGNRTIGMMSAQSYRPHAYSDDDLSRLDMLAAQTAVALENARLFATTERRAMHLLTAAEVARDAAVLSTDTDELLQRAVNLVRDRFGFYHAGLFLVDEAGEYAVLKAATGKIGRQMIRLGHRLKIGETGIVGYVTHTGKPRIADNVALDRVHYKNPLLPHTRAEMAVPLRIGQQVIGALDVQSTQPNAFSPEDVAVLQTLADQIAIAIRNAQLYQRERRRRKALEALRQAGLRLTASLDLQHVTETILEQAMALSQAWDVHLFLYDGQDLRFAGARWREPEHNPPFLQPRREGATYTVARTGQPLIIPDMQRHPLYAETEWHGAIASLPLRIGNQVRGVLNVAFNRPHPFDEDEIQVLQLLADQAAIALENAHLYRELEQGYIDTILALGRAINARDAYTADHSADLTELAVATAQELGCDESTVQNTRWAALLHDIGKIGIPDHILNKPGPLTPEERQVIEQHPDIGADIVAPIRRLAHLAPIIRAHQEKFDGSGYPRGLQGEDIPIEARIVAVVDAYSAMIDERVYKPAIPPPEAIAELQRQAGTHFDPQVVAAFLRVLQRRGQL